MDFDNGRYDDRVMGKLPEWRASDGKLREKKVNHQKGKLTEKDNKQENIKEKEETLTGYTPSEKENKEGTAPKKIIDIGSSYGTFSVGSNKKKELVTVTSQRRKRGANTVYNDSKKLDSESAVKWQKSYASVRTNNARRDVSAVEFKSDTDQQVSFLMEKMRKRVVDKEQFEVHEEIIPIFSSKNEKAELEFLRQKRKILVSKQAKVRDKQEVENQIEYLEGIIAEKMMEKRRVFGKLEQARLEIKDKPKPSDSIANFFKILQNAILGDGTDEDDNELNSNIIDNTIEIDDETSE